MDPDFVDKMFHFGGTLIINGMPEGTEVGIDLMSWIIQKEFKGIKMIPPGLHFVYLSTVNNYGQNAPRTGFFHCFQQKEVLVKEYNTEEEDIFDDKDDDKVSRIKDHIKDLNKCLLPYPFDTWTKWVSFSQHIDEVNLKRMEPSSGKISTVQLTNENNIKQMKSLKGADKSKNEGIIHPKENKDNDDTPSDVKQNEASTSKEDFRKPDSRLPVLVPCLGTEICFSKIPDKPHKDGASPAEISRGNLDSSYCMSVILERLDRPESILAEIQFAFLCFFVGQVWEGWEQWRQLVILLCKAEDTLLSHPSIYSELLSILFHQLQEIPEDLFTDIVESNNFMVMSLRTLFANIFDNATTLPIALVTKARKFRKNLSLKYKWNLVLEEDDDDKPVVVEI